MDKKQKRITFFMSKFLAGGGPRVMIDAANWSAQQGYEVDLLVLNPAGRYADQVAKNVNVISLQRRRPFLSFFPLVSYLRYRKPDALLALDEDTHLLSLAARTWAEVHTRIVLRFGTTFSVLYGEYSGVRRWLVPLLSRRLYPRAEKVIANSQGVAKDAERLFAMPSNKFEVIFNPKNIAEIRAAALQGDTPHPWLATERTEPVLVTSGRLREVKDIPTLLQAFAHLQAKLPSRFIIVGEGKERQALIELATELGVAQRVAFVDYAENPHAYVARADVFVSASIREGLPNALIEALICGTPVISTDCDSGPREVLAPDTDPFKRITKGVEWAQYGVLVPVHGVEEMAEALFELLSTPAIRADYKDKAQERAEAFDAQDILKHYLSILTS